jgi:hypothetical protein
MTSNSRLCSLSVQKQASRLRLILAEARCKLVYPPLIPHFCRLQLQRSYVLDSDNYEHR